MKKLLLFFNFCFVLLFFAAAQNDVFTYQAVVRDADGKLVTSTTVGAKISVRHNSPNGTVVYCETHTAATTAQGLATFQIGRGTVVSGSLQNIDWGDGTYFLKSEIDIAGGSNYTLTSTQQILGVPLALYAQTAGNLPVFDYHALPDTPTVVSHFVNDAGYLTDYVETQELSFSNDTLFLTGGSFVVLPIPRPNTDSLSNIIDSLRNVLYSLHRAPKVQTLSFVVIDSNNAEGAGEVVLEGLGGNVTSRGFCWNTTGRPSFADNVIDKGSGVGVFTTQMQELTKDNTYYVRAFAINATDTVFGTEVAFVTAPLGNDCDSLQALLDSLIEVSDSLLENNRAPMVLTMSFEAVDTATVSGAGEVVFEGLQGSVTSRGFCYNTTGGPTLADSVRAYGSGLGVFTLQIEGLVASTAYYVRAFAINATDTAYGNEVTVTTFGLPVVTTDTAYANGFTRGQLFGTIADDGGSAITARGFVYNNSGNPTMADTVLVVGAGMGTFSGTAEHLEVATTYYVKAFAINALDTVYGNEVTFTTLGFPDFTLDSAQADSHSAIVYVTILDDGGDQIVERGLCYSIENESPTRDDNLLVCGMGSESFSDTLKRLTSRTTYYVTAYLMTPHGLYYSMPLTFTTEHGDGDPCPGDSVVIDHDNNLYKTIWIHNQCWMKENLRVQYFADDTQIDYLGCGEQHGCYDYGYHMPGENLGVWESDHGLLYDYHTAIKEDCSCEEPDTRQGVCPDGWVMPTLEDWQSISDYVQAHPDHFIDRCLGWTEGWFDTYGDCNDSYWNQECSDYEYMAWAYYWTYDKLGTYSAYGVSMDLEGNWYEDFFDQGAYLGVRCIKENKPRVSTSSMDASGNSVEVYGEILSENEAPVTSYGFCYGVTTKPTVENDSVVEVGTSLVSSFDAIISKFEPNVTYYIRAYATNSYGTGYGKTYEFIYVGVDAKSCPGEDSILVDLDGNEYATLLVDGQCWMRSNMRVTQTNDGVGMVRSDPNEYYYDDNYSPYYAYPNNEADAVEYYGNLYNYEAATSVCPTGWHLPLREEWDALNSYVLNNGLACNESYTAKALASYAGWLYYSIDEPCSVGNNIAENNVSGFSWMPAGHMQYDAGGYQEEAYLWLAIPYDIDNSYYAYLGLWDAMPSCQNYTSNSTYFSVRCVKSYVPVLGATTVDAVDMTSATLVSEVLDEGTESIMEVGFCFNTTGMPTVDDYSFVVTYNGIGTISGSVASLSTSTQMYYVRSYAITDGDTTYGLESKFVKPVIDAKSCSGATSVTDWDGNVYSTVQIGSQCWMRENMKATHYEGGAVVTLSTAWNTVTPCCYYPANKQENVAAFGLLYNWPAAMNGAASTNTGQVQGICPEGWHVPTQMEWITLLSNVQGDSENWCNDNSSRIVAALSADACWRYSNTTCAVGNPEAQHNQTGFSALPAGYNYSNDVETNAYFWSSYQSSSQNSYYTQWGYDSYAAYSYNYSASKAYKYSVRCIKND